MRYHVSIALVVTALALNAVACGGVAGQHKAINYARLGVEATAIGADAADLAVHEAYGDKPASDDESYCKKKIAAIVFAQTRITLNGALDLINVWERGVSTYEAKQEMGTETEADWSIVLSSEAEWFKYLVDVAAVLEGVRLTLKLWGIKIPPVLDKAWGILSGMAGKDVVALTFTFDELQGSICFDKVPPELSGGE